MQYVELFVCEFSKSIEASKQSCQLTEQVYNLNQEILMPFKKAYQKLKRYYCFGYLNCSQIGLPWRQFFVSLDSYAAAAAAADSIG